MEPRVYDALGVSVAAIEAMPRDPPSRSTPADVTYGTNSEFGFDYLRDNMAALEQPVQRGHRYAIVDEVDSILIDEARTPLIISGAAEQAAADLLHWRVSPNCRASRPRGTKLDESQDSRSSTTSSSTRSTRRSR